MTTRALSLLLVLTLATSGCARLASSSLNPLNWFGPSQPVSAAERGPLLDPSRRVVPVDGRRAIAQVTALEVARTPGGAIVQASGLSTFSGAFNADLVVTGRSADTLVLAFRVGVPPTAEPATQPVTVARSFTTQELAGVRTVQVSAEANALQVRR